MIHLARLPREVVLNPNVLSGLFGFNTTLARTEPDKIHPCMSATTAEAVLARLAEWRDSHTWVDCTVGSHHSSFGYRVIGLVSDFDDGFVIGSSVDRCASIFRSSLCRRSDLIELDDETGALRLRFPHGEIRILEVPRTGEGHA